MLGRFLSDTYNKVRHKADEVRLQVTQQAAKAREALGIGRPMTAAQLERQLEAQAAQIHSPYALGEIYKRWTSQIIQSERGGGCSRYPDTPHPEEMTNEKVSSSFLSTAIMTTPPDSSTTPTIPPPSMHAISGGGEEGENVGEGREEGEDKGKKEEGSEVVVTALERENRLLSPSNTVLSSSTVGDTEKDGERVFQAACGGGSEDSGTTISGGGSSVVMNSGFLENGGGGGDYLWGGDVGLTFKQVFLRSQALEISLKAIVVQTEVCQEFLGPVEDVEVHTPRAHLQQLLSVCLRGDSKLHRDLLCLLLTTDASNKAHLYWVSEIITVLKHDWHDDRLFDVRRQIANEIQLLKLSLRQTIAPPTAMLSSTGEEGDESAMVEASRKHEERIRLSQRLIILHKNIEVNLHQAVENRKYMADETHDRLVSLMGTLGVSAKNCDTFVNSANGRKVELQNAMSKESEDLLHRVAEVDGKRRDVDKEIKGLEVRREELRKSLEEVGERLAGLQEIQRGLIIETEKYKNDLETVQFRFKGKLASEGELQLHSEQQKRDVQNIDALTQQATAQLTKMLIHLTEELSTKALRIKLPIREVLYKHLSFEKARLQHHEEVLQYYIHVLRSIANRKENIAIGNEGKSSNDLMTFPSTTCSSDGRSGGGDFTPPPPPSVGGVSGSSNTTVASITTTEEEEGQKCQRNEEGDSSSSTGNDVKTSLSVSLHSSEFDTRHRFAKAIAQLENIWLDIQNFAKENSQILAEPLPPEPPSRRLSFSFGNLSVESAAAGGGASAIDVSSSYSSSPATTTDGSIPEESPQLLDLRSLMEELEKIYRRIKRRVAPFMDLLAGSASSHSPHHNLHHPQQQQQQQQYPHHPHPISSISFSPVASSPMLTTPSSPPSSIPSSVTLFSVDSASSLSHPSPSYTSPSSTLSPSSSAISSSFSSAPPPTVPTFPIPPQVSEVPVSSSPYFAVCPPPPATIPPPSPEPPAQIEGG